jgi:multidrug efflux pump subunit AcrA (membrane-fusion protein)
MRIFFLVLTITLFTSVVAHEGHDDTPPPSLPTLSLAPRVVTHSADLELVGLVKDGQLVIYLDVFATNEPITNAKIEVESGNFKAIAQATKTGYYLLPAEKLLTHGKHELVFTIETPALSDLLLGDIEIPSHTSHISPEVESDVILKTLWQLVTTGSWQNLLHSPTALYGTLGMTLFLLLIVLLVRYVGKSKHSQLTLSQSTSTTTLLVLLLTALLFSVISTVSVAHEGETHQEEAVKPSAPLPPADAPSRLADSTVWVPKPVQHLWGIRTQVAKTTQVAASVELNGHIIPDPNYSGRVQAPLAGWIELAPHGLPNLGEKVETGQTLAYLNLITSNVDRTNLQVEWANLSGQMDILNRSIERLKKLGNNAVRKELDEAEAELKSLQSRRTVITGNLSTKLPLNAPITGVIATSQAFPGQVVEARDTLFEIVNPDKFWVEALVYEIALAEQLGKAQAVTAGHQILSLTFIGRPYQLREHALPIQFRIEPPLPLLSAAQPVKVFVQTKQKVQGILLPHAAVLKGNQNDSVIWVHDQAEHFKPVQGRVQVIDGSQVVVLTGLQDGDRVVVQGATLLSQIR